MSTSQVSSEVTGAVASVIRNPEPSTPPPRSARPEEDEEGDLNKALGVERFHQILNPAPRVPDEQYRSYNEEDFEYHRHSSHHIHHPLSKLPSDGRKKKGGKKKKSGSRKTATGPSGAPTIEEGEEEEEEEEDEEECCSPPEEGGLTTTPGPAPDAAAGAQAGQVQFFLSEDTPITISSSPPPVQELSIVPGMAFDRDTILPEEVTSTDAQDSPLTVLKDGKEASGSTPAPPGATPLDPCVLYWA
ncbi:hypothetical protein SKAU_G00056940 [Synaphobranchus kaupii]|uniref:Uncharacterized protein n=1 Tax=Synaphobranchus kaupii TaxID=118154 RepID=A0A9Q1G560_SYNKA|nr:hypothetical protein SKAU_G00056940 [Synaphobranchus kaupii]